MIKRRTSELIVGIFMLLGIGALVVLALQVSGLVNPEEGSGYRVIANFANIGSLKPRAPVTIAGVRIGQVERIRLNPQTYEAEVTLYINKTNRLPRDTSASIFTQGLLGANYISLDPGYENAELKTGDKILQTHPALILENLIGQFLFKANEKKS